MGSWVRDLAGEGIEPNPGPTRKVWVANLTSFATGWGALADGDWDALLVQEPRMAGHEEVLKKLKDDGCQWLPGPVDATGKCLVATVIRTGEAIAEADPDEPRMQHVTWQTADAPPVLLTNTYGDAAGTPAARAHTAAMLGDAMGRHVAHGRGISILVGDFNATMPELACTYALELAGWRDVEDSEPTALPPNSATLRRIDHVVANEPARHAMRDYVVDWSHGLPVHAVQKFSLSFDKDMYERKWHPPPGLPVPLSSGSTRAEAWGRAFAEHEAALREAERRRCPERFWKALQGALLSYAGDRAGIGEPARRKAGIARWQPIRRRTPPDGRSPNQPYYWAAKRERRLRAALAHWTPTGFKGAGCQAWEACMRADQGDPSWVYPEYPTREELVELLAEAERLVGQTLGEIAQGRRDGWLKWADQSLSVGSGPLYKWVRTGPRQAPEPFVSEPHETPGPQAKVDRMDSYWWGLWGKEPKVSYNVRRWMRHLRALPAMEAPGAVTVQQLLRVLKKWGKRKAPGMDGWRPAELKDLPEAALEWIVRFFRVIEERGRWPQQLRKAGVAMLTKKGTAAPDDRRPIVLLPILYRWWAAVRAQQVQDWLRSCGILEKGAAASAETMATDLAFIFQRARAFGAHVDGIALDWSKCYDRVPLKVVEEALQTAGVPPAIWKPLMDMYRAERRILADGKAGEPGLPTHCIPAGCPAATMVLALLMYTWRCELHAAVPEVQSRAYVDDLTAVRERKPGEADGAGAAAVVSRMQQVALDFEADFGLQVNVVKSVRYSSDAHTRLALKETEGVAIAPQFVDLGADQSLRAKPSYEKRTERDEGMLVRAARIGFLPIPYQARATMTAASAVSAGMYAAAVGPVPMHDLREMRKASFAAIWRARYRVPMELAFAHFVSWRADPYAVAVVKPWAYLRDAARRALTSEAELAELWEACGDTFVGPIAAARQAMRLAGLSGSPSELRHEASGNTIRPLRATARELQDFLLGSLYATECRWVATARPELAVWALGVDRWATFRAMHKRSNADRDGLLRNVMAGGSITQQVAQKWVPGGELCPHCQQEPESAVHKFWHCPKWQEARDGALPKVRQVEICSRSPEAMLTLGVLPSETGYHPAPRWPRPRAVGTCLYSDGSAIHPADHFLRRAAWAVTWQENGVWRWQAGPVPGRQTVGRAELCAAIWAYRSNRCPDEICIDNRYVVDGVAACMRGYAPKYVEGKDADLWRLLVDARPLREPIWVPSHRPLAEFVQRGFSAAQWEGNAMADKVAKVAAAALRPEPTLVARRALQLRDLAAAQDVLAAVHKAVLEERDAGWQGRRRLAKRKRAVRMALFSKIRLPKALRIRRWKPPPADPTDADAPGIHSLVPAEGQPGPAKRGCYRWGIRCTKCGASKGWTQQWPALARTVCPSEASAVAAFRVEKHDLIREGPAFRCSRCLLAFPAVQRARMARTRCGVPVPIDVDGNAVPSAQAAARFASGAGDRWRARVLGTGKQAHRDRARARAGPGGPAPRNAPAPAPARLVWRAHITVTGGGCSWCLLCGGRDTARTKHLVGTACPGPGAPPPALLAALRGRLLDVALARASPAAVGRAEALGWNAIPLPGLSRACESDVPASGGSGPDGAGGPAGRCPAKPGPSVSSSGTLDRWVRSTSRGSAPGSAPVAPAAPAP